MAVRDELSGRTLGEFVLRERIGEGGFGAVYRCEQPLLGREAVIKVLHTSLRNSEVVLQRFTREAQLASRLDHPYAAHIYAFGVEKEDGLCWIAMELVQGTTLDRWLRERGPLPIAQLVPFFERVAEVVQTAHEAGIVHRDLKPSNIMVIERAGRLLPKLLDFGIAKMVASKEPPRRRTEPRPVLIVGDEATALPPGEVAPTPPLPLPPAPPERPRQSEIATLPPDASAPSIPSGSGGDLHRLTKDDAAMGSPPYMSPEQWLDATRVGPSSDLYALGIVAYEALLGRRPFVATSLTALAKMHCHDDVPPVGEGFPASFDRFFARALAKEAEDRPATALELAATLRIAAGIGSAPEDLPRLDEGVRDAWLAEAPQHLAESVAGLDGARNVHQARDAARDLFRGLVRYLVAIALAARAQVRTERDDPSVRELLRALRTRELDDDERIKLLRLLVRPFTTKRGAYPVPELVDFVGRAGDERDPVEMMLGLRPSTDHGGTEDIVRSQLVQFIPALAKVMRAASFVLDYALVIPRDQVPERWMGMRRQRRTVAVVRTADLVGDQPLLLDRVGHRALGLWPLVQAVAPTVGTERELFVFDGRGRLGARLTAAPAGYEHHDAGVWDWYAEHVLGEIEGAALANEGERAPYLGLASFAAADADRFVGREREIDTFINRLRRQALQVVVGPSGAGKSSFVHAGVVPGLPAGWRTVTLRPGMAPLTALASRLVAASVSTTDLRPIFESAPAAAAALVAHAAGDGAIVIVVDQLEELFTLCPDPVERDKFAAALAHLSASADGATRVICTVRDDFLMHVESLAPLRAALSPALFLIGNPSRDDLIRTIVEPARRTGYELSDPELAAEMVDVVADRPGALALLSFTASRLWELRDRRFRQLTRKAYDAMGGVAGALGQHAESTFLSLVADEQRVAREAFRHLVTADHTRAVLTTDELRQRLASARSDGVIAKLVDARLLAVVEGETHSQIEIIHEALIAAWPRLQQWTRDDTVDSRSREQIAAAAKQWADRNRPRELLWRGELLLELSLLQPRASLTDVETAFAAASRADAARGTRLRRALVTFAIAITAVFVAVLVRANSHAQQAQGHAEDLLRDSTFDQGRLRMLQGDKLGALPFLAQAYRMGETGPANRLMIEEVLRTTRARVGTLVGHTDKLWQVVYSPDGKQLATASLDGTARIWDAATGAVLATVKLDGAALSVAYSPDGSLLAVGGRDPNVRIWDVAAGRQRAALPVIERVTQVLFSPDGTQILTAEDSGFTAWAVTGARVHDFDAVKAGVGLAYSADGLRMAAWDTLGNVTIYDAHTLAVLRAYVARGGIVAGAIDATGTVVAVGTGDGELDLVRTDGTTLTKSGAHGKTINSIAFAPDGKTLATASSDGTARLWEVDGTPRATLVGHSGGLWRVDFSPDGELVVTASSDGTARLWTAATGTPRGELVGHTGTIAATVFRRDGARLVTASWDHRAIQWDVATAQQFRALPNATSEPDARAKVKYAADRRALAMIAADGRLVVWADGRTVCQSPSAAPIADFVWSADGTTLATLSSDPSAGVSVLDAQRCVLVRQLAPAGGAFAMAFAPDGRLAVGADQRVEMWDLRSGRHETTYTDYPGYVVYLNSSGDGRLLAVTHREGAPSEVVVQTLGASPARQTYRAGLSPMSEVALDARHHRVIASSYDHQAWMWDEGSRDPIEKLEGTGPLFGARVSADDAVYVAIGGNSPTVWSAETQSRIGLLKGHADLVVSGGFIGDRIFVTAGLDGVARVWDLATLNPLMTFGGARAADVSRDGAAVVLVDGAGTREWLPQFPVPDFAELERLQ